MYHVAFHRVQFPDLLVKFGSLNDGGTRDLANRICGRPGNRSKCQKPYRFEKIVNPVLHAIHSWLASRNLEIAPHKSEVMVLTMK